MERYRQILITFKQEDTDADRFDEENHSDLKEELIKLLEYYKISGEVSISIRQMNKC